MSELKHPVPSQLLEHIGDITVSFAMLEGVIQGLVGPMINEHQRVGQIITAELSFKNLRALAISLYLERHGEDDDFGDLRELMKRAGQTEQARNRITHSVWAAGKTPDTITRVKTTAKEKHGVQFKFEQLGASDLAEVAEEARALAFDIQKFMIKLIDEGKAINSPIQKTW